MNDSAISSMAKVTSPPSPSPECSRPAWLPSSGSTRSRSARARSVTVSRTRFLSAHSAGLAAAGQGVRALLELDGDLLAVAVGVDHLEGHLLTRLVLGDQHRQVALLDQLLAVDGDDHIAAPRD